MGTCFGARTHEPTRLSFEITQSLSPGTCCLPSLPGHLPLWALDSSSLHLLSQLVKPGWEQHSAAVAALPAAVQDGLVTLLLDHTLPAVAEAAEAAAGGSGNRCDSGGGGDLPDGMAIIMGGHVHAGSPADLASFVEVLESLPLCLLLPSLQPRVRQRVRSPGGAATLRQAAQLFHALVPAQPLAAEEWESLEPAVYATAKLVTLLTDRLTSAEPSQAQAASSALPSSGSKKRGSRSSGSGSGSGDAQLQHLPPAVVAEVLQMWPAVARVLLQLNAAYAGLAAHRHALLTGVLQMLAFVLHRTGRLIVMRGLDSLVEHADAAFAAADAAMQLMPLCFQVAAAAVDAHELPPRQLAAPNEFLKAAAELCLGISTYASEAGNSEEVDAIAAACRAHTALLWRYHSTTCRAVHAVVAQAHTNPGLAAGLLADLFSLLNMALRMALAGFDGTGQHLRCALSRCPVGCHCVEHTCGPSKCLWCCPQDCARWLFLALHTHHTCLPSPVQPEPPSTDRRSH